MNATAFSRRDLMALTATTCLSSLLSKSTLAQITGAPNTPPASSAPTSQPVPRIPDTLARQWLAAWEKRIGGESRDRACDKELGEELGWLVSPLLDGFYYGYLATRNPVWLDRLVEMSDAWTKRGIVEPDGFIGWPKADGASTSVMPGLFTDNILGEAMAMRSMVLLSVLVREQPALKEKYGPPAGRYLKLAEQTFEKWTARGCWRDLAGGGGVWVVPPFGIEKDHSSAGYADRHTGGFTLPANKQNMVAQWILALHEATRNDVYRERAGRWFTTLKSRLRLREGKYLVWNYWDPAGPWDYKPDGSTRHWVGVHPNGGYYLVDVDAMVCAYEHRLVFNFEDVQRLIATNRDFMWNGHIEHATFKRIDGEPDDPEKKITGGMLWPSLIGYDATLFRIFLANHQPDSWGALRDTPRMIAQFAKLG